MNFQDLKTVESPDFYLDVAIKRMKKKVESMRQQLPYGTPLLRSKRIELSKLDFIEQEIHNQLMNILKSYPSIDNLSEFYRQLLEVTLDVPYLKKSLASLQWCTEKNRQFLKLYQHKIKQTTEIQRINEYRREFYGRIASTLKQIKSHLAYIEFSRRTMLDFPSIKTSLTTVAIAGFPNVGKSTLLSKLTTAKPKIAAYAFTTQGINLGYAEIDGKKIQFMDTPGTLARFERQNTIEKVATLALKYVAEAIIYVFDITEASSPLKNQVELYEVMKKTRKPIIVYLSKTDVADEKDLEEFRKKYKDAVTTPEEIEEWLKKIKTI